MWMAIRVGSDEMHIIPAKDLIEHIRSDECICGPVTTYLPEGGKMITHSSLDGRELNEPDWKG